jgi:hypothetical protein
MGKFRSLKGTNINTPSRTDMTKTDGRFESAVVLIPWPVKVVRSLESSEFKPIPAVHQLGCILAQSSITQVKVKEEGVFSKSLLILGSNRLAIYVLQKVKYMGKRYTNEQSDALVLGGEQRWGGAY